MYGRGWPGRAVLTVLSAAMLLLGLSQATGTMLRTRASEPVPAAQTREARFITGTVIRRETVIPGSSDGWIRLKENGEKVAVGEALLRQADESPTVEQQILSQARALEELSLPRRRELLRELISGEGELDGIMLAALMRCEAQLPEWTEPAAEGEVLIRAEESGLFSSFTDGMEYLCPENWTERKMLPPADRDAMGKIVSGERWYLAFFSEEAMEPGDRLTAELLCGVFQTAALTVEECVPAAGGWQVLVGCDTALEQMTGIRRMTIKILED